MKPGNTPLVELHNLAPEGTRLFAKLEWHNPTGSVKDRPAWNMFMEDKAKGLFVEGEPLIEATSGNTGIGLARVALLHGNPMNICLPTSASKERQQILQAYGANLILVEGGPNDAIAHAKSLVEAGEGHMCYQYGNVANPAAHEFGTALEIIRDWPLDTPPDHFLCAYGTGGTITGNSRGLKNHWSDLAIHSVEEDLSDTIGGMRSQDDPFQPPVADLGLVKDRHVVTRTIAEAKVAEIMKLEGHFVGTSSGAVIEAAQRELSANGGTAVVILPDAGWKYLSNAPWV
jgi:cysteine synthase B